MKKLKWIHHSSRPWVTVVADDTIKTCNSITFKNYFGFVSNAKKHTYLSQRKSFSYNLIKFMYFKQYEIQLYFMALKVLSDASNTYISLKVLLPLKRISTAVFEYSSQTQNSTQKWKDFDHQNNRAKKNTIHQTWRVLPEM